MGMGRQRENLAVQTVQELPIEEKKEGEGKKANVDSQEKEERSLVKSKHRTRNGSQKKIVLGGPKEIEAREAFRKVMKAFRKVSRMVMEAFRNVVSRLPTRKGCKQCFNPHKGRGKDQQGKGKEGAYPQHGLSASETLSEKYGHSWGSDDWYSSLSEDSSC